MLNQELIKIWMAVPQEFQAGVEGGLLSVNHGVLRTADGVIRGHLIPAGEPETLAELGVSTVGLTLSSLPLLMAVGLVAAQGRRIEHALSRLQDTVEKIAKEAERERWQRVVAGAQFVDGLEQHGEGRSELTDRRSRLDEAHHYYLDRLREENKARRDPSKTSPSEAIAHAAIIVSASASTAVFARLCLVDRDGPRRAEKAINDAKEETDKGCAALARVLLRQLDAWKPPAGVALFGSGKRNRLQDHVEKRLQSPARALDVLRELQTFAERQPFADWSDTTEAVALREAWRKQKASIDVGFLMGMDAAMPALLGQVEHSGDGSVVREDYLRRLPRHSDHACFLDKGVPTGRNGDGKSGDAGAPSRESAQGGPAPTEPTPQVS